MILAALFLALVPTPEPEAVASHMWVIHEIFSDPTGTVQFVEMKECCGAPSENFVGGLDVSCDVSGQSFVFPANLTGNTANRFLLLGTAAFAAQPGAPTPDQILPDNFFSIAGDTIRWYIYPTATMTFSAAQLPLNGLLSLNRDGSTAVNSPTNYAGQSGSINLAGPVPAASRAWILGLAGVAGALGLLVLRRNGSSSP